MGNNQNKKLIKDEYGEKKFSEEDDLKKDLYECLYKAFSPDALMVDDILNKFWLDNKSTIFDWTNIVNINKHKDKNHTNNLLKLDFFESILTPILASLKYSDITANLFNTSRFTKYVITDNLFIYDNNVEEYTLYKLKQMHILLIAFTKKVLSSINETTSIDCITKYINNSSNIYSLKNDSYGQICWGIIIKLLENSSIKDSNITNETIEYLSDIFKYMKPLSLRTDGIYQVVETSLNNLCDFIVKTIDKKILNNESLCDNKNINLMSNSIKLLLKIGLATGSINIFIKIIKIFNIKEIKEIIMHININSELFELKNEIIKLYVSLPLSNNQKFLSKIWEQDIYNILNKDETNKLNNDKKNYCISSDGSYLYLYIFTGFLLKIGTGYNNTTLGKIYLIKEMFHSSEIAYIAAIQGVLYFRSPNTEPYQLESYLTENFEKLNNLENNKYLWVDTKKSYIYDVERPIYNDLVNQKQCLGHDTKNIQRPKCSSPLISDGRFIYILSKWHDDLETYTDKPENGYDEEIVNLKRVNPSIFGVDIFDPLICKERNNIKYINSIQLKVNKKNLDNYNDYDLLKPNTYYYTNGHVLVAGNFIFSLLDGEDISFDYANKSNFHNILDYSINNKDTNKDSTVSKDILCTCYDINTNNIWALSIINEEIFITSFVNKSLIPLIEYQEYNKQYSGCSIVSILSNVEQLLYSNNIIDKQEISSKSSYDYTLKILGLLDKEDNEKNINNIDNACIDDKQNTNNSLIKNCYICLILTNLARLSEYYGQIPDINQENNEIDKGKLLFNVTRRPFCVKLTKEVFSDLTYFMLLLEKYSDNYKFNKNIKSNKNNLKLYSLISVIKLIKTNLNCLLASNLNLNLFADNNCFFKKIKNFVLNIINDYHDLVKKTTDENQLIDNVYYSLYLECINILKSSFSILFSNSIEDLIKFLQDNLTTYESDNSNLYCKEIITCFIYWLAKEKNIVIILKFIINSKYDNCKTTIINIINTVLSWETKSLKNNISNIVKFSFPNIEVNLMLNSSNNLFLTNDLSKLSLEFLTTLQIQIIKFLSQNILSEDYSNYDCQNILGLFTECLINSTNEILKCLTEFLDSNLILNLIEEEWNLINIIIDKFKNSPLLNNNDSELNYKFNCYQNYFSSKEEITNFEKTYDSNKNIFVKERLYGAILKINSNLLDKINIFKLLNFHINSLALLSSDYFTSAFLFDKFTETYKLLNNLNSKTYTLQKYFKDSFKEDLVNNFKNKIDLFKELTFESEHNLKISDKEFVIYIRGATKYVFSFDPRCNIKDCNLGFYKSNNMIEKNLIFNESIFKENCSEIKYEYKGKGPIYAYFKTCSNVEEQKLWGYKFNVNNNKIINENSNNTFIDILCKSLVWIMCKIGGIMLRSVFSKSNFNDEDEVKYNLIAESCLLAGGIEEEYLFGDYNYNNKQIKPKEFSVVYKLLQDIVKKSCYNNLSCNKQNMTIKDNNLIYKFVLNSYVLAYKYCDKTQTQNSTFKKLMSQDNNIIISNLNKNIFNCLFYLFQKKLKKEVYWYSLGGLEGDFQVVSCFSIIVHLINKNKVFNMLAQNILNYLKNNKEIALENIVIEDYNTLFDSNSEQSLTNNNNYNILYKIWQQASNMRTWLNNKKKLIMDTLDKQTDINEFKEFNYLETTSTDNRTNDDNKKKLVEDINKNVVESKLNDLIFKINNQILHKFIFLFNVLPQSNILDNDIEELKLEADSLDYNNVLNSSKITTSNNRKMSNSNNKLQSKKSLSSKNTKIITSKLNSLSNEEKEVNIKSLKDNVLLFLQSDISTKKIITKLKISTLKSKSRMVAFKYFANLIKITSNKTYLKYILTWIFTSLKFKDSLSTKDDDDFNYDDKNNEEYISNDNSLCKLADYANGIIGLNNLNNIRSEFYNFLTALIEKIIREEHVLELQGYIKALLWKYSSNDIQYLVDSNIFDVLSGCYNNSIRDVWGSVIKPVLNYDALDLKRISNETQNNYSKWYNGIPYNKLKENQFNLEIINSFDVLVSLCIEKISKKQYINLKNNNTEKLVGNTPLQKKQSVLNSNESQLLLDQIFIILFKEVNSASLSYIKNRGVCWNIANQINNNNNNNNTNLIEYDRTLEVLENTSENENNSILNNTANTEKKHNKINEIKHKTNKDDYDINLKYDKDMKFYLTNKDDYLLNNDILNLQSINKNFYDIIISLSDFNNISNLFKKQMNNIYDDTYLYRLLLIILKISAQIKSTIILNNLSNGYYIVSLFKLFRICSTQCKHLIIKILNNIINYVFNNSLESKKTESILYDIGNSVEYFLIPNDKVTEQYVSYIKSNVIDNNKNYSTSDLVYLIELIIKDLKYHSENKDCMESEDAYTLKNKLEELGLNILTYYNFNYIESLNSAIQSLYNYIIENDNNSKNVKDLVETITVKLDILYGGDVGIYTGSYFKSLKTYTCKSANNCLNDKKSTQECKNNINNFIDFGFLKGEYTEKFNYGVILGFSKLLNSETLEKLNIISPKEIDLEACVLYENELLLYNNMYSKNSFLKNHTYENINKIIPLTYSEVRNLKNNFEHVIQTNSKYDVLNTNIANNININLLIEILTKLLKNINTENNKYFFDFNLVVARFMFNLSNSKEGNSALTKLFSTNHLIFNKIIDLSKIMINYSYNNYMNLKFLETIRFNILNMCTSSNSFIKKENYVSFSFDYPDYLYISINFSEYNSQYDFMYKESYKMISIHNFKLLKYVVLFDSHAYIMDEEINFNCLDDEHEIIIINPLHIKKFIQQYKENSSTFNNIKLVITHSIEPLLNGSTIKNNEETIELKNTKNLNNCSKIREDLNNIDLCITTIDYSFYNDIIGLHNSLESNTILKNTIFKKLFENNIKINDEDIISLFGNNIASYLKDNISKIKEIIINLEQYGFNKSDIVMLIKEDHLLINNEYELISKLSNKINYLINDQEENNNNSMDKDDSNIEEENNNNSKDKDHSNIEEENKNTNDYDNNIDSISINNCNKVNQTIDNFDKKNNEQPTIEFEQNNNNICTEYIDIKEEDKLKHNFYNLLIHNTQAKNYYNRYINICKIASVLYIRRLLLSLYLSEVNNLNIDNIQTINQSKEKSKNQQLENISKTGILFSPSMMDFNSLIGLIKLMMNEGLYSNSINQSNYILIKIRSLLINLIKYNCNNFKIQFMNFVLNEFDTFFETKNSSEIDDNNIVDKLANIEKQYTFVVFNDISALELPNILLCLWGSSLINNDSFLYVNKNYLYNIVKYCIKLIFTIKNNNIVKWISLEILLKIINNLNEYIVLNNKDLEDCLEKFNNLESNEKLKNKINKKLNNLLLSLSHVHSLFNCFNNLKKHLDIILNNIDKELYTKTCKMLFELLIFYENLLKTNLEVKDNIRKHKNTLDAILLNNLNNFEEHFDIYNSNINNKCNRELVINETNMPKNLIVDLLDNFDFIKNFFNREFIKYLGWIDLNKELLCELQLNFESDHFYAKAPHSMLIHRPEASELNIKICKESMFDTNDCLLLTLNKTTDNSIFTYCGKNNQEIINVKSSYVFLHFPASYLTKAYAFGDNTYNKLSLKGLDNSISKDILTPKLIHSLCKIEIDDILITDNCVIAKTNNLNTLICGKPFIKYSEKEDNISSFEFSSSIYSYNEEHFGKIKQICSYEENVSDTSIIVDNNNIIYVYSKNCLDNNDLNKIEKKIIFKENIVKVCSGSYSISLLTSEKNMYFMGENYDNMSGDFNNIDKYQEFTKIKFNKLNMQLEDICCGFYHSLFLFKVTNGINTGKCLIHSSGSCSYGALGHGNNKNVSYCKLISSTKDISFEKIYARYNVSYAITFDTKKLYVWGQNTYGQLGLNHYNDVEVPTLNEYIQYDKGYKVEDVSIGTNHLLILTSRINEYGENVYSVMSCGLSDNGRLGEKIPLNKYEINNTCPVPIIISFFENKKPYKIFAGGDSSIVLCNNDEYKNKEEFIDTYCSSCLNSNLENKCYIKYNLYVLIDNKKSTIDYQCKECIDKVDNIDNNILVLVFKTQFNKSKLHMFNTILNKNINSDINELLDMYVKTCNQCNISIAKNVDNKNISYLTYYCNKNNKYMNLCYNCFNQYPSCVTSAKPYIFRKKINSLTNINEDNSSVLINKFKELKLKEVLNSFNYYNMSSNYGYKLTIDPILNEKGSKMIINKNKISYDNFINSIKDADNYETYEQFTNLINNTCFKQDKNPLELSKDLKFKKEDLVLRDKLNKFNDEVYKNMYSILKLFNNKIKDFIQYIDFSDSLLDTKLNNFNYRNSGALSSRINNYYGKITSLIFYKLKSKIIEQAISLNNSNKLENSSTDTNPIEITVNRLKIKNFIEKGACDNNGEFTMFGNIYQNLKLLPGTYYWKDKTELFSIKFIGEGSIDAGGPYREALNSAWIELQSESLPLLIKSPNQKNDSGKYREKWILNPSAKSKVQLDMFRFLGCLIGFAIRCKEFLSLDLPSLFWKQLVDIPLERKDLEYIDNDIINSLDNIYNCEGKDINEENFNYIFDQKFTTLLSSNEEIEIVEGGKDIDLTYHNRIKYCELVEKIRLNESKLQVEFIKKGLNSVVPINALRILSANELETLVCGEAILDIELLKENTTYDGYTKNDTVIKYFWKMLEEFSTEERAMYLRFVWGRSRLPLTSKDFATTHKIHM